MRVSREIAVRGETPENRAYIYLSFDESLWVHVRNDATETYVSLTPKQALDLMEPIVEAIKVRREKIRQRVAANKARKKAAANAA